MFGPLDVTGFLVLAKNIGSRDIQTQNRGCSRDNVTSNDAKMKSWQQIQQMATILDCNYMLRMASEEQKRENLQHLTTSHLTEKGYVSKRMRPLFFFKCKNNKK